MLTKGNFTRDDWNHLLCLFNISHFSSAECSEVMSKRTQKTSGEERVTAKSRPMMNLVARSSERAPTALSSTASKSPEKTGHESQTPLSPRKLRSTIERGDPLFAHSERTNPLYVHTHQATQHGILIKTWSSQEWKSDELMDDRTGRPVVCSQRASQTRFSRDCKNVILEEDANHDRTGRPVVCSQRAHQFVVENDETHSCTKAESELSSGSSSFLHWVNDQVRKRQKQSSKYATEDSDEHSVIWRMFMSSTFQASVFMEKNYSDNWHSRRSHNETDVRHI